MKEATYLTADYSWENLLTYFPVKMEIEKGTFTDQRTVFLHFVGERVR